MLYIAIVSLSLLGLLAVWKITGKGGHKKNYTFRRKDFKKFPASIITDNEDPKEVILSGRIPQQACTKEGMTLILDDEDERDNRVKQMLLSNPIISYTTGEVPKPQFYDE